LDQTLIKLGFNWCVTEHGMYIRGDARGRLIVGVYVDDLIITGTDRDMVGKFKVEMQNVFKMSDLGLLSYYLGIEVHQSKQGITVSRTPMEARLHLSKEGPTPRVDDISYRSLIGSLRYLVNTRPDLAYSVDYVSRFMEKPREEHMNAMKRILRYVTGTVHWGVTFIVGDEGTHPILVGFSNSDMADDPVDRKSTSGMIYFLSNNPITWQSSKQKVVALSSCEAEYIASSAAACQGV
jgi:hypothetical protein